MRSHHVGLMRVGVVLGALAALHVAHGNARALPSPGPLRFIAPTPAAGAVVTASPVSVRLDATCTLDTATLAVTINGTAIPASAFLPFSACTNGRKTSQTASVSVTLPNGTITGGPTALITGDTGNYTGTGTGDGLAWNFDGGAAPSSGASVNATFEPAGTFVVRLTATKAQNLAASALDGGNLVGGSRSFAAGDPTPATRQVAVAMPPDVDFVNWESSQVHPLALSAAGDRLYAINTPDARLAIFDVAADGSLTFAGDVPVGLDPVSLATRPGSNEVWVVNHLSDTVSIVDGVAGTLLDTLKVGDEPTDVVFASNRAFVSLSGNENRVRVYNAATRAQVVALDIFGEGPRALAANAAGTEVYAVVLESGNQSTTLFTELVVDGGGLPAPNPPRNVPNAPGPAPSVGLIVQRDTGGVWRDETGDNWGSSINYALPDSDVFVIDADAATPSVLRTASRVGTILFDVAVRPGTNPPELWVANTDARNLVRFEPKLRGNLVRTRVSKVNSSTGAVTPVDVNSHINYAVTPGSAGEIAQSVAHPGDGVFNAAGSTFYLTALGSRKVAVLNSAGAVVDRIDVGEGPSGVALNEADASLYVLNRFDNTISIVDTGAGAEIDTIGVSGPAAFDPSPDVIKVGRKFLYDGQLTSGHGDTACATCHVSSNFDKLAWDLGDPQGDFVDYGDISFVTFGPLLGPSTQGFDPMKGPMTTQTLRGLENLEPFHWRGDRPDFQAFNPAFVGLMGMRGTCSISGALCNSGDDCPAGQSCRGLSVANMDAYTDFIMTVRFPPNPFRNPNNTMPNSITVPEQTGGGATTLGFPNAGQTIYINNALDAGVFTCNQCHLLPTGTTTNLFNGNAEGESQDFKIPHLRNMYEKVGFGVIRPGLQSGNPSNIGTTNQRSGFGFIHDGSVSLTEFLAANVFTSTDQQEEDLFAFMMAFPTETAPAVGVQVTLNLGNKNDSTLVTQVGTLTSQVLVGACDVIVKGVIGGDTKGYVYNPFANNFIPDSLEGQIGRAHV